MHGIAKADLQEVIGTAIVRAMGSTLAPVVTSPQC